LLEEEIIIGCQQNSPKAQEELYKRYSRKLQGVVMLYIRSREESKDILHEAFIKIYTGVKGFNFQGSFEGWMRRIVVNTTLSYLKGKKKLNFTGFDDSKEIPQEEGESEPTYPEFTKEKLFELIYSIPDKYRIIFVLSSVEGLSHREIALQLNITEEGSRTRLKRSKEMLRSLIA